MKGMIYVTLIFTAMLSLSSTVFAGMLLLSDDFKSYALWTDASPVWLTHSRKWVVTEEGFNGINCSGSSVAQGASTGKKEWADYIVLNTDDVLYEVFRLAGEKMAR